MAGVYGSNWSATDPLTNAPGSTHDAPLRTYRNVFNFADSGVGGTTNPLRIARLREGSHLEAVHIQSDQNLSGVNISGGITGDTAKYVAAAAGPNATFQRMLVKLAALDDDAIGAMEEIILTPSGNWPASGTLVTWVHASHR